MLAEFTECQRYWHSVFLFHKDQNLNRTIRHFYGFFIIGVTCLLGRWLPLHAAVHPGNVQLLQSDREGVVVEYRPVFLSPRKVMIGGTEYLQFPLKGGRNADFPIA